MNPSDEVAQPVDNTVGAAAEVFAADFGALTSMAVDVVADAVDVVEKAVAVPSVAVAHVRAVMARYEHDIIGQAHYLWQELVDLLAGAERAA
jgi:hypothetical protein